MNQLQRTRDIPLRYRASQRITVTIPYVVFDKIRTLSEQEGRSFSNCAAYYLERGLETFSGS